MTRIEAEKYINLCESEFFTGSHSVSFITNDLQTRKAFDAYSPLISNPRQTNELWQKKQVYFETFNNAVVTLNYILTEFPNSEWNTRCKICKNKIDELRNLVQNF